MPIDSTVLVRESSVPCSSRGPPSVNKPSDPLPNTPEHDEARRATERRAKRVKANFEARVEYNRAKQLWSRVGYFARDCLANQAPLLTEGDMIENIDAFHAENREALAFQRDSLAADQEQAAAEVTLQREFARDFSRFGIAPDGSRVYTPHREPVEAGGPPFLHCPLCLPLSS